jgi:hypothetical protein
VAKAVLQRKGDEASATLFARQQEKSGALEAVPSGQVPPGR